MFNAILRMPSFPWYTAYILAMMASNAWAVQILEVAFYLLICCYLVCKAILYPRFPYASFDIPIILPGIFLTLAFFVAKNPEYGPPKPIGTPNLWEEPKQISAPIEPGDFVTVSPSKSEATTLTVLCLSSSTFLKKSVKSVIIPWASGVCTKIPQYYSALYFDERNYL